MRYIITIAAFPFAYQGIEIHYKRSQRQRARSRSSIHLHDGRYEWRHHRETQLIRENVYNMNGCFLLISSTHRRLNAHKLYKKQKSLTLADQKTNQYMWRLQLGLELSFFSFFSFFHIFCYYYFVS